MRTIAGRNVQAWDYKQKKNLVIVFLHADCASCADFIAGLASQASDLKKREAVALIVYLETPPMTLAGPLPPEIVVGADISGRSLRAYSAEGTTGSGGLDTLGVFVTDRYGDLYAQWIIRRDHQFPGIVEILSWLGQIEIACEECCVTH